MTVTILDLENWSANGATAELLRKCLTVRLSFRLNEAPVVPSLGNSTREEKHGMVPTMLAVEYSKTNDGPWEISVLRAYGYRADKPDEREVNIYPHENMHSRAIPAWIRDAAYKGMPDRKEEGE